MILLSVVAVSLQTIVVFANVPSVLNITRRTNGTDTIVDVLVSHLNPSPTHYILQINLDLDGTIRSFTNLPKATTDVATYSLDIGSANPKVIKAQAVCNIHGPGAYFTEGGNTVASQSSGGGGISGYPTEAIVGGLLLSVTVLFVISKHTRLANQP